MSDVKLLDCTLRDGGYINNWAFGQHRIKGIIDNLAESRIEIVECGFIRRVRKDLDSSVFCSMQQMSEVIRPKKSSTQYAVMIEQHNHVDEEIPKYDGTGADIIRVTFRHDEWPGCKKTISSLIKKGYKVCVQPVGTTNYSDEEIIKLIKDVNELHPFAFYLVDTLGVMYRNDIRAFFYLADKNLNHDINIGIHLHNNLQMAFANAQELMRLSAKRDIIIDSSCYGMGRGCGNLATELIVDYINTNINQKYSVIPILNIVDKYLMPIYAEHRWGYDLPYLLSAIVKCHPNYAQHFLCKETLTIESIQKLLNLIPKAERGEFNETLAEKLYVQLQSSEIEDAIATEKLKAIIANREVIIMGPGPSILEDREKITSCRLGKFLIMTNFISDLYDADALFISNQKRLNKETDKAVDLILSTSNLSIPNSLVFNYSSLLGEGAATDNAGAMLIRILKKIGVKKILLAGFDGFGVDSTKNFAISDFKKTIEYDFAVQKNEEIARQLKSALSGISYEFLTRTKYDI